MRRIIHIANLLPIFVAASISAVANVYLGWWNVDAAGAFMFGVVFGGFASWLSGKKAE